MKKLLWRSSKNGQLVTGISLKPIPLTQKQEEKLAELREKGSQSKEREKLEAKLIEIPDNKLSAGAKTYVEDRWYGDHFGYKKSFYSRFTDKGNSEEDRSIKALSTYIGTFGTKNKEHLSNDYIKGTPDVRLKSPACTIDMKNVYYPNGLRFFSSKAEETDYIWQIHSYNWLDNKEDGFIARILLNPPEHILEKEAYSLWKQAGNKGQFDEQFFNDVKDHFDFESKRPIEDRVNMIPVHTTQDHIDILKKASELATEYYHELSEEFKGRNQKALEYFKTK